MQTKAKTSAFVVILLIGLYLVSQAIADVGATKLITIRGVIMPAGTLIFALTFTLRDVIHKRLGVEWARGAIIVAGILNVLQAVYLHFMAQIEAPVFFGLADSWNLIFATVPAITVGSIISEIVSELVDTEVYHAIAEKTKLPQWVRVLASNAVSLPLDSFLFGVLAFVLLPMLFKSEGHTFVHAMEIVGGQILWKFIVTIVSMPAIYLTKEAEVA